MSEQQLTTISGADLAIGIQFQTAVGERRQLTLTAGVPMDWDEKEIRGALDKMADAVAYLERRYYLQDLKKFLERREQELRTQETQRDLFEENARKSFGRRGRNGDWRPTGQEQAAIDNYGKTIEAFRGDIKNVRKEIAELEKAQ
jgi:hypothetical protein